MLSKARQLRPSTLGYVANTQCLDMHEVSFFHCTVLV